jgi:hypothetical protein
MIRLTGGAVTGLAELARAGSYWVYCSSERCQFGSPSRRSIADSRPRDSTNFRELQPAYLRDGQILSFAVRRGILVGSTTYGSFGIAFAGLAVESSRRDDSEWFGQGPFRKPAGTRRS